METNIEKLEKITDELRMIRDLKEYSSNSKEHLDELLNTITKLYDTILYESKDLEDIDIKKANEYIDKLIKAQPELKEIREKLDKRIKITSNLKLLEQTKYNLTNINNITDYREHNKKDFEKDIENIISSISIIKANTEKYDDDYYKALTYINEIIDKHPKLAEFKNIFLDEKEELKTPEEKTKEIENKFENEKQNLKVNMLTENIETLKNKKITNQKELNKYRDLIETYKKDIVNNQNLTDEQKQELINKLDKDNQIISMLEILGQKEIIQGGPSL